MNRPIYPCQFGQVGSKAKELYVDNLVEHNGPIAHMWCYGKKEIREYGDGIPLAFMCSFLRRHLAGNTEPVMDRPASAKEWQVVNTAEVKA